MNLMAKYLRIGDIISNEDFPYGRKITNIRSSTLDNKIRIETGKLITYVYPEHVFKVENKIDEDRLRKVL